MTCYHFLVKHIYDYTIHMIFICLKNFIKNDYNYDNRYHFVLNGIVTSDTLTSIVRMLEDQGKYPFGRSRYMAYANSGYHQRKSLKFIKIPLKIVFLLFHIFIIFITSSAFSLYILSFFNLSSDNPYYMVTFSS